MCDISKKPIRKTKTKFSFGQLVDFLIGNRMAGASVRVCAKSMCGVISTSEDCVAAAAAASMVSSTCERQIGVSERV